MKKMLQKFVKDEDGASAVEYGLLVALISVMIIIGAKALGTNLNKTFNDVAGTVAGS